MGTTDQERTGEEKPMDSIRNCEFLVARGVHLRNAGILHEIGKPLEKVDPRLKNTLREKLPGGESFY